MIIHNEVVGTILNLLTLVAQLSLPLWERGLKCLIACRVVVCVLSLPLWERGLKCVSHTVNMQDYIVAPLVGAWIEIKTY